MVTLLLLMFGLVGTAYGGAAGYGRSQRLKMDGAIAWATLATLPAQPLRLPATTPSDEEASAIGRLRRIGFCVIESAAVTRGGDEPGLIDGIVFAIPSAMPCPKCGNRARDLYLPDRNNAFPVDAGDGFGFGSFCDRRACGWDGIRLRKDCRNLLTNAIASEGTLMTALDYLENRLGSLRDMIRRYRRLDACLRELDDEEGRQELQTDPYGHVVIVHDSARVLRHERRQADRREISERMHKLHREIAALTAFLDPPAFMLDP